MCQIPRNPCPESRAFLAFSLMGPVRVPVRSRSARATRSRVSPSFDNPCPRPKCPPKPSVPSSRRSSRRRRSDSGRRARARPTAAARTACTCRRREWLLLAITNRSAQAVNVSVLDLSSDWSVTVIADAAGQRSFLVPANGGQFRLPLKGNLATGQSKGTDLLKVNATVDPPPGFDLLTLPPLHRPIVSAAVSRSAGPLAALLAAALWDGRRPVP